MAGLLHFIQLEAVRLSSGELERACCDFPSEQTTESRRDTHAVSLRYEF